MDYLTAQTELERVLALDTVLQDAQDVGEACQRSAELWRIGSAYETCGLIIRAGLIYGFKTTKLPTTGAPKFTAVQIDPNKPLTDDWEQFCLSHLGMTADTASGYKRLWEVYVVKYGFSIRDLARAGKAKLVALVHRVDNDPDPEALRLLFGAPHVCNECNEYVAFTDEPPEICPHCGTEFEPVPPATYAQTLLSMDASREREAQQRARSGRPTLTATVEVEDEVIRLVPMFLVDEDRYPLDVWEIAIIPDEAFGEGVPRRLAPALVALLRGVFG